MEKKMVLLVKEGYEGRNDIVYAVDEEGFSRLAHDLVEGWNDYPDELPKLELAMWTPEKLAEAERIGEEMA